MSADHGAAREADITQDMCNMVAHYLTQTGIQIRIDGTGKGNLPLREAVKLIKGARWPLSFIAMLLPISLQKDVELLAHSRDKAINLPKHCKAVSSVMNNPLRGAAEWKPESSGLAYVHMAVSSISCFFISNNAELQTGYDKKWLETKAVAQLLIQLLIDEAN